MGTRSSVKPAATSSLAILTPGGRVGLIALYEREMALLTTPLDAVVDAMSEGFYNSSGYVE